jgi:hypothetical protein
MELMVQDVPARVLDKLTDDARKRDVSINDAAVSILADIYGIDREPTGAKFKQPLVRPTLLLDLPEDLHRAVKMGAAATKGATMRGLIVAALATHYKVAAPSTQRRRRGTVTATR